MRYAGFWRRFNAYGIDCLLVMILSFLVDCSLSEPVRAVFAVHALVDDANQSLFDVMLVQQYGPRGAMRLYYMLSLIKLSVVVSAFYNIAFVASDWMATPGKRWLGMQVMTQEGSKLSPLHSAARHLMSGVSLGVLSGLGYLPIFFTAQKLALHDMICHTRVIRVEQPS